MDITLSPEGRFEGELASSTGAARFSGTLELLKLLEDLVSASTPHHMVGSGPCGPGAPWLADSD
jgi:hypothetical protein